jgi:hypothetical protein
MDELTAREIGRKYANTAGLILRKGENKPTPVWFGELGQNNDETFFMQVYTNINKRDREQVILGTNLELKSTNTPLHTFTILPMPDRQVFDFEGVSYVYARYPQRQFRKGVCHDNAVIGSPIHRIVDESLKPKTSTYEVLGRRPSRLSLKDMYNLFDPCYASSFEEALRDIAELKLVSRALTKDYFISLFPSEEKQYVLFRLDLPLAYYNKDKNLFTVIDKVYEQEIKDFCRRQDINAKIEV